MHRNATPTHHSNANLPTRILHSYPDGVWHLKRVVRGKKETTREKTSANGSRTGQRSSTHSIWPPQRGHHKGHGSTRLWCSLHHCYITPNHLSRMLHVRGQLRPLAISQINHIHRRRHSATNAKSGGRLGRMPSSQRSNTYPMLTRSRPRRKDTRRTHCPRRIDGRMVREQRRDKDNHRRIRIPGKQDRRIRICHQVVTKHREKRHMAGVDHHINEDPGIPHGSYHTLQGALG